MSKDNWFLRSSDYLEGLTDRYGFWGIFPGAGLMLLVVVSMIFSGFWVASKIWPHPSENSITCSEGHFTQRARFNAATKTTQMVTVFVCDK